MATGTAGMDAVSESMPTCSSDARELAPGTTRETIEVGGVSRTFWLIVPSAYDASKPAPLVLELHGLGLDGEAMSDPLYSGWGPVAEREALVLVRPDGIDNAWNVGPCCTRERTVDDVAFARALVERVTSRGCIDRRRVYATGYSMGGGMSHYLACHASDVFAAVAPAAFDLLEENASTCMPKRPITVVSFRGTADTIARAEPHESVPPTLLISGYSLPPIHFLGPEGTLERWAELNGCTGMPATGADGCRTHDKCNAGVEVTLCLEEGGGHEPADAERAWTTLSRFTLP
jgi:poly(3-hydroxybutyrate) depolymerase